MSRPLSLILSTGLSAAALVAAAGSAQAQSYGAQSRYDGPQGSQSYSECVRQQRNRQVAGAVIGGILGAVIGAELHDDAQDNARERGRGYRGGRHYRDQRYHRGRYNHRRNRGRHYEEGNDGAVVAGGAVGAVAGAAIAGRSDCDSYARTGYGYGSAPGHYGADQRRGAAQPIYDERGRVYNDGYGGDPYGNDPYSGQYQGEYAYDQGSSGVLLGGEEYSRDARAYSVQSAPARASTGPCQNMRSGNGALVLMCQGPDGIWRPG